jgi:hypothetical protein
MENCKNEKAEPCEECSGTGVKHTLDLMNAKTGKEICKACRGTGRKLQMPTDGLRVGKLIGEVFFFQWLVENEAIATLEVRIMPVRGGSGEPLFNMIGPRRIPRLMGEIPRMATRSRYRKQGIMSKLLAQAIADPKIEWMETSWDDSSADGRNFLLGRGFKQETRPTGSILIWRRKDSSLTTPEIPEDQEE